MAAPFSDVSAAAPTRDPIDGLRARAAADARMLRALARMAQRDGLPKAELRSANARAAARRVCDHARQLSALRVTVPGGVRPSEMAD